MKTEQSTELGIYVHIPFCVHKCAYCDFLSAPGSKETMHQYVQALIREIRNRKELIHQYHVRSVFMGGGTPSLLSSEDFSSIVQALRDCGVDESVTEWTVEANPGTITEEKARVWKSCGVNRISMGAQSANDQELKMLGRIHCWEQVEESVHLLRSLGFPNLNLDLMMGLPHQTLESWKQTLEKAVALRPEHLSCYSLIVEEGTPMARWVEEGTVTLPEEEEERAMYEQTRLYLSWHGYEHYEISNFAQKGYASIHNLSYWDLSSYLGLGLGSSSYIHGERWKNESSLMSYLQAEHPSSLTYVEQPWSEKDAMEEWMFLGLRKICGIEAEAFASLFGVEVEQVYGTELIQLINQGLLQKKTVEQKQKSKTYYSLTRRGLDIANVVFEAFIR